jgi:hypothetical protein
VSIAIFYPAFFSLLSISSRAKIRLLEWKGRLDLAMYVSRCVPKLFLEEVTYYPAGNDWETEFKSSILHPNDDGDLSKMVRAVANVKRLGKPFEAGGKENDL